MTAIRLTVVTLVAATTTLISTAATAVTSLRSSVLLRFRAVTGEMAFRTTVVTTSLHLSRLSGFTLNTFVGTVTSQMSSLLAVIARNGGHISFLLGLGTVAATVTFLSTIITSHGTSGLSALVASIIITTSEIAAVVVSVTRSV